MTDTIRVDLHCHSYLSDGDHSPEHLAQRLAAAGVAWAALTDHNTLDGQERFRAAAEERGVHFVPGLEMDARSTDGPLHLLAYGFDLGDQALRRALHSVRRPLRSTARYWVRRARSLGGRASLPGAGRARVGGVSPYRPPDVAAAIDLIHGAGGLAFLAHPLAALLTVERLEDLLDRVQPLGLDGLEAFYKPCSVGEQSDLLAVAERRGLLAIAGSDFHGLHHAFGASPGVDMRREHWERFAARLGLGCEAPRRAADDGSATMRWQLDC
ncbi:MAG TPA: PHP domain-containing protein [Thermoleophilia bacterium]|nr:PHP domain-containing protein [Thermoleophilia bacterium]